MSEENKTIYLDSVRGREKRQQYKMWTTLERKWEEDSRTKNKPFCHVCARLDWNKNNLQDIAVYREGMKLVKGPIIHRKKNSKIIDRIQFKYECPNYHGHTMSFMPYELNVDDVTGKPIKEGKKNDK